MSVDPVLATTYQSRRTLAACRAGAVLPAAYRPNTSNDDRSVGRDLDVIGLTTNGRLVRFDAADPVRGRDLGRVKGLVGDASLVGIDYRVQDGKLYGVGDQGGIYTISTRGAVATMVSRLTVPLQGASFGVDFNPTAKGEPARWTGRLPRLRLLDLRRVLLR
jgi:hypothetical protein